MDSAVRRIEQQVALLLRLADRNRRRSPRLERTLDRSAYLALRQLADGGPAGINEIADHLRLDASTVTRQVVAMEQAGYVSRGRDDSDGRRVVIEMTDAGRAELAATADARAEVYGDVLAEWSDPDLDLLAELLGRLNDSLEAHTRAVDARTA